jgi:hypothetical protein
MTILLRSEAIQLSEADVIEMIVRHGFYEKDRNPDGKGFSHQYKLQVINGDNVILDESTGLIWQQSGSSKNIIFEDVKKYIDELNEKRFAGFHDWRFPTLEEAVSLMEPIRNYYIYIDPIFDSKQSWIWTADQVQGKSQKVWIVYFRMGICYSILSKKGIGSVRAVRSAQSS